MEPCTGSRACDATPAFDPLSDRDQGSPCLVFGAPLQHPGQSCAGHAIGILPHAYARALGIYVPVYLVPALLVHRWAADPLLACGALCGVGIQLHTV